MRTEPHSNPEPCSTQSMGKTSTNTSTADFISDFAVLDSPDSADSAGEIAEESNHLPVKSNLDGNESGSSAMRSSKSFTLPSAAMKPLTNESIDIAPVVDILLDDTELSYLFSAAELRTRDTDEPFQRRFTSIVETFGSRLSSEARTSELKEIAKLIENEAEVVVEKVREAKLDPDGTNSKRSRETHQREKHLQQLHPGGQKSPSSNTERADNSHTHPISAFIYSSEAIQFLRQGVRDLSIVDDFERDSILRSQDSGSDGASRSKLSKSQER